MLATKGGHTETVKVLINASADATLRKQVCFSIAGEDQLKI